MIDVTVAQLFRDSAAYLGKSVRLKGWVRTRRDSKAGISFIQLSDGSCFDSAQVVVANTVANYANEIQRLTASCAVIAEGEVVASQGKGQSVELQASKVEVVGWVEDPDSYPVHQFFNDRGFCWIHTPIITGNDCEGAGQMFRVSTLDLANIPKTPEGKVDFSQDFFGREAHLTVSGQLNVETWCAALSKVYTFGPTFRAENSNTSRHLSEFWMIEPEIAFASLVEDAQLAEDLLKFMFKALLNERGDDLKFFAERIDKECITRLEKLVEAPFERMNYTDGIAHLEAAIAKGHKFEYPVSWGTDLQSEHERYLTEQLVGRPVILMNYPKDIKAFYMRMNDDGKTVAAMDILAPGIGEIVGGSQREERLDMLDKRIDEMKLDRNAYWWYRDLRRYGTVPHAGFGLGFERAIVYATGMANIRDVIPFARTPKSCEF